MAPTITRTGGSQKRVRATQHSSWYTIIVLIKKNIKPHICLENHRFFHENSQCWGGVGWNYLNRWFFDFGSIFIWKEPAVLFSWILVSQTDGSLILNFNGRNQRVLKSNTSHITGIYPQRHGIDRVLSREPTVLKGFWNDLHEPLLKMKYPSHRWYLPGTYQAHTVGTFQVPHPTRSPGSHLARDSATGEIPPTHASGRRGRRRRSSARHPMPRSSALASPSSLRRCATMCILL